MTETVATKINDEIFLAQNPELSCR